jgi:hypothetical protein
MSEIQQYHKKKNLFKFFKSDQFNEARMKMCAIYVLISYANELHEDVDRLLCGFDGMMIGMLKHKSKLASKALEEYDREYALHIEGGMGQVADTTILATTEIETAIKQNQFFLQEGYKAVVKSIKEQMDKTINDPEQLKKEQFAGFEIFDPESRKATLEETLKRVARIEKDNPNLDTLLAGVKKGFNVACDYVNEVYLKS